METIEIFKLVFALLVFHKNYVCIVIMVASRMTCNKHLSTHNVRGEWKKCPVLASTQPAVQLVSVVGRTHGLAPGVLLQHRGATSTAGRTASTSGGGGGPARPGGTTPCRFIRVQRGLDLTATI